jgi:tetratricopeptide (TPR) repeat protein
VFWVHASNTARLEQSFRGIAELVKVRGRKEPQADVFKLVQDWLRDEKNGRWLLVVDNADDAGALSAQVGDSQKSQADDGDGDSSNMRALQHPLSRYLPPSRHGCVLVTSRTRQAAMQLVEDSDIIAIEPMDDAAAHALLRKKLGDEGKKRDSNNDIAELAAALDHMPLALVQAAAYIRQRAPRCSVQQYLKEYRQSDSRATSLLNQRAGHLRRDEAASNAILITWQISFDHVRSSRQSAADLLSLMSFFDRQGIPEALLRSRDSTANNSDDNDDDFEDDLDTLRDYSFVTVTRDAKTFEMHSLVQLATRKWLESQQQLNRWREQFISNLCVELPTGEHENWERCQALFPHARAALSQRPASQKSLEEWALLLYKAAWYAWQQGKAGEAEQMSMMSMEVRREVLGKESKETSDSMGLVGLARSLGGKYEEAEAVHRQTLAMREKALGHEHPDTLASMNNLALVLDRQGKYEEAEAMHRQELAICEKVLGREHPSTLTSMNNLAGVLDRQGKYEEAEAMHRQTLATREKVLGREHPSTLASVYCLAHLLAQQGCYKESLTLYDRACAGHSVVLGDYHPTTRTCYKYRSTVASQMEAPVAHSRVDPDNAISAPTGQERVASRELMHVYQPPVEPVPDLRLPSLNRKGISDAVKSVVTSSATPPPAENSLVSKSFRTDAEEMEEMNSLTHIAIGPVGRPTEEDTMPQVEQEEYANHDSKDHDGGVCANILGPAARLKRQFLQLAQYTGWGVKDGHRRIEWLCVRLVSLNTERCAYRFNKGLR